MDTRVNLVKIPYYSDDTKDTVRKINSAAKISDGEIIAASAKKAKRDTDKSLTAKVSRLVFPTTVGAFVLNDMAKTKIKAGDVIKKAPPSAKLAAGVLSLASWLIFIKSFDIAGKVSDKAAKKTDNETAKAGISIAGTIAGGMALYAGATKLLQKGIGALGKKMPDKMASLSKKAAEFDKNFSANGFVKSIKKHIGEPLSAFAAKHPKLTGTLSRNSRGIIFISSILAAVGLGIGLANKEKKEFENNIDTMFQTREEAKFASQILKDSKNAYNKQFNKDEFSTDAAKILNAAEHSAKDLDEAASDAIYNMTE
ncbi:TPA: hypothetical protein IAA68_05430 [Candidatus Galligastranaerophilus faecipullorum]|nr:hypothetical protein [Candidatus Galligastranaerophilus faecipullorum]